MAASGMSFTDKATSALADAQDLAQQYSHTQLQPIHLAVALLDPPPDLSKDQQNQTGHDSHSASSAPLFKQVVERAHGDPQLLTRALNKAMVRLPSQDPPPEHLSMSPAFSKLLRAADQLSKTQKDSYIAIDHLISCLVQDSTVSKALAEANVPNTKLIHNAIQQIRGNKRVDSKTADAEEESENLKKFTIDMTAMAREGKMDPVIGREEEIRRVIRILSRRT
ncbi:putative heat shock protein Hsp98/Hsp104/ClpA, partial [Aureobasidium melanogenum]